MKFNNLEIGTEISVIENDKGQTLFDLVEVAAALGIKNPKDAVRHFLDKYPRVRGRASLVSNSWICTEGDMYLFALRSRSEKAELFQEWVAHEVVPTVKRAGMQAVYKLALLEARGRGEIKTVEDMLRIAPKEIVDEALATGDYYRQQGYLAPSDFGVPLAKFYEKLISEKYLTLEGDLIRTDMGVLCTRWSCSRLPNGKWYAWKPEVADLFSTPSVEELSLVSTPSETRLELSL